MACNCNEEGKTINIGMGCCVPIVANADAYYTKSEIDEKIDEIVISGGGITSGEVQAMIDESIVDKADKSEIPTVPTSNSAFTNDAGYLTEHQPIKTINGNVLVGTGNVQLDIPKIWHGTKAEYELIQNKDADTIYLVYEN